jgi:peptidoglycan/LPS O-acetylase OafA/YrhL
MLNSVAGTTRPSPNNFGALRLLFATLVVLSHSPELVDGDRSREILTRIFGTLSFGELGVDGFFLISGYLITKSFQDSHSAGRYLLKRVLRIYPGYVVAYLLCVFALGPFVGGHITELSGTQVLREIVGLRQPQMQGVFPGTPYPMLNGSMWTIAYEFRCYLLVLAAGLIGLLSRRSILACIAIGLLALSAMHSNIWDWFPASLQGILGEPDRLVRFAGIFACGALYFLYRDRIRYDWRLAVLAALGLIVLMFWSHLAEAALAIFGGYILFWFAFNVRSSRLAAIGQKVDISYGVYLYAWPLQKLLLWWNPGISPWFVFIDTTAIASLLAFGSWWLVEKPFLNLKTAFGPRSLTSVRKSGMKPRAAKTN